MPAVTLPAKLQAVVDAILAHATWHHDVTVLWGHADVYSTDPSDTVCVHWALDLTARGNLAAVLFTSIKRADGGSLTCVPSTVFDGDQEPTFDVASVFALECARAITMRAARLDRDTHAVVRSSTKGGVAYVPKRGSRRVH